jgi:hypothetical protein
MKRHGNLWPQIIDVVNIANAHRLAKRGKGHYTAVKMVDNDWWFYVNEIHGMLANKTFTTGKYEIEDRFVGHKMRRIFKLPYYPDRIVQHALFSIIGPLIQKSLIRDTFQSLPKRGTSDARRRVQKFMSQDTPPRYALKVDIKKFYPSVNNDILLKQIESKFKCANTLWLLKDIVNSHQGLPIGNLSSQYLGNLYLNDFDWWVKQSLKPQGYYRYADDLIVFANTKETLRTYLSLITEKLFELRLELKDNFQIVDVYKQGIDFVGYVFKPNSTRVRKRIASNFKAKVKNAKRGDLESFFAALVSYRGWLMRVKGKKLWRAHVTHDVIKSFEGLRETNPLKRRL